MKDDQLTKGEMKTLEEEGVKYPWSPRQTLKYIYLWREAEDEIKRLQAELGHASR